MYFPPTYVPKSGPAIKILKMMENGKPLTQHTTTNPSTGEAQS